MLGGVGGGEFGVWDEDSGELIEALAELRYTQLVYLPHITMILNRLSTGMTYRKS